MLNLNFNPFPVLSTERLLLRQMTLDDVNELFIMRSDKEVMKYIQRPIAQSPHDAVELVQRINDGLQNASGITWAIAQKEDNKLIGTIGFWRIVHETGMGEIGYMLSPLHQGKGVMQEALDRAFEYGFNIIGLKEVEAHINPDNAASIKLMVRNGFTLKEYLKDNHFHDDKYWDTMIYALQK